MKKSYIQSACRFFNAVAAKTLCCISFVLFSVAGVNAQVTIGSSEKPAGGALLELKENAPDVNNATATKGMLFPRVQLTDRTELYPMFSFSDNTYNDNKAALKTQHVGLTVFNTVNSGDFIEGFYMWSGTEWRKLDDLIAREPEISSWDLTKAVLDPPTYTDNTPYKGVLKIPYEGGNGAPYKGGSVYGTNNGLMLELYEGKLNTGKGEIVYLVSGTPDYSSPYITTSPISFLNQTGSVQFGGIVTVVNTCHLLTDLEVNVNFNGTYWNNATLNTPLDSARNELIFNKPIKPEEPGSYAVAVRLYATPATSGEFYIFLGSPNPTNSSLIDIYDSAEMNMIILNGEQNSVSYTVVLGAKVTEQNRELKVYMQRNSSYIPIGSSYGANTRKTMTLKSIASGMHPYLTSLTWWKL